MRVYVLRCVHGINDRARPECDVWAYRTLAKAVQELLMKVPSDLETEVRLARRGDDEMVLDQWFDEEDARWCLTAEELEE